MAVGNFGETRGLPALAATHLPHEARAPRRRLALGRSWTSCSISDRREAFAAPRGRLSARSERSRFFEEGVIQGKDGKEIDQQALPAPGW